MFKSLSRTQHSHRIDLCSVRDTLLYIESDIAGTAEYQALASAVRSALSEIARLEADGGAIAKRPATAARFLPARL